MKRHRDHAFEPVEAAPLFCVLLGAASVFLVLFAVYAVSPVSQSASEGQSALYESLKSLLENAKHPGLLHGSFASNICFFPAGRFETGWAGDSGRKSTKEGRAGHPDANDKAASAGRDDGAGRGDHKGDGTDDRDGGGTGQDDVDQQGEGQDDRDQEGHGQDEWGDPKLEKVASSSHILYQRAMAKLFEELMSIVDPEHGTATRMLADLQRLAELRAVMVIPVDQGRGAVVWVIGRGAYCLRRIPAAVDPIAHKRTTLGVALKDVLQWVCGVTVVLSVLFLLWRRCWTKSDLGLGDHRRPGFPAPSGHPPARDAAAAEPPPTDTTPGTHRFDPWGRRKHMAARRRRSQAADRRAISQPTLIALPLSLADILLGCLGGLVLLMLLAWLSRPWPSASPRAGFVGPTTGVVSKSDAPSLASRTDQGAASLSDGEAAGGRLSAFSVGDLRRESRRMLAHDVADRLFGTWQIHASLLRAGTRTAIVRERPFSEQAEITTSERDILPLLCQLEVLLRQSQSLLSASDDSGEESVADVVERVLGSVSGLATSSQANRISLVQQEANLLVVDSAISRLERSDLMSLRQTLVLSSTNDMVKLHADLQDAYFDATEYLTADVAESTMFKVRLATEAFPEPKLTPALEPERRVAKKLRRQRLVNRKREAGGASGARAPVRLSRRAAEVPKEMEAVGATGQVLAGVPELLTVRGAQLVPGDQFRTTPPVLSSETDRLSGSSDLQTGRRTRLEDTVASSGPDFSDPSAKDVSPGNVQGISPGVPSQASASQSPPDAILFLPPLYADPPQQKMLGSEANPAHPPAASFPWVLSAVTIALVTLCIASRPAAAGEGGKSRLNFRLPPLSKAKRRHEKSDITSSCGVIARRLAHLARTILPTGRFGRDRVLLTIGLEEQELRQGGIQVSHARCRAGEEYAVSVPSRRDGIRQAESYHALVMLDGLLCEGSPVAGADFTRRSRQFVLRPDREGVGRATLLVFYGTFYLGSVHLSLSAGGREERPSRFPALIRQRRDLRITARFDCVLTVFSHRTSPTGLQLVCYRPDAQDLWTWLGSWAVAELCVGPAQDPKQAIFERVSASPAANDAVGELREAGAALVVSDELRVPWGWLRTGDQQEIQTDRMSPTLDLVENLTFSRLAVIGTSLPSFLSDATGNVRLFTPRQYLDALRRRPDQCPRAVYLFDATELSALADAVSQMEPVAAWPPLVVAINIDSGCAPGEVVTELDAWLTAFTSKINCAAVICTWFAVPRKVAKRFWLTFSSETRLDAANIGSCFLKAYATVNEAFSGWETAYALVADRHARFCSSPGDLLASTPDAVIRMPVGARLADLARRVRSFGERSAVSVDELLIAVETAETSHQLSQANVRIIIDRVVQHLCEEHRVQSGCNLNASIVALGKTERIPAEWLHTLHLLRTRGNAGAHDYADAENSLVTLECCFSLIRWLYRDRAGPA
jgi:hypothetical protein